MTTHKHTTIWMAASGIAVILIWIAAILIILG